MSGNEAGAGLPKQYRPAETEPRIRELWEGSGAFHADPQRVAGGTAKPYSIIIPPPNVTAALHLGHALNNTIQDILVRAHRMMGFETLWMPGTDHAGIATQAVVERRVFKEEGKRRTEFSRDEFVAKIQAFKDEYEAVITGQLKAMGCSCDWDRQRFTMDEQCARAVREAFFRLFKDGLIYRGKRLVNWDPVLQTAVADDECYEEEVQGAFYYLRYPLVHASAVRNEKEDPQPVTWNELARRGYPGADEHPGEEQAWVTVATTRPETYLGDTAVGVNPHDPRAKSLRGLFVELPLVGRIIPIIEDDYVVLPESMARTDEERNDPKAKMATGFLKVTPAHDPNDYELGQRHKAEIEAAGIAVMINVMAPDGSISDKHGWSDVGDAHIFVGKTREQARKDVVHAFSDRGLLEGTRPHAHSVKHSDRSKAIVEPYLSDQWYVRVTHPRMAQAANAALVSEQRTAHPGRGAPGGPESRPTAEAGPGADGDEAMRFYPARYAKTYENWHDNIRDWCISRQLWWGHRIPVWRIRLSTAGFESPLDPASHVTELTQRASAWAGTLDQIAATVGLAGHFCTRSEASVCGLQTIEGDPPEQMFVAALSTEASDLLSFIIKYSVSNHDQKSLALLRDNYGEDASSLASGLDSSIVIGAEQDPDVLDTWFSSALWPLSTMGWPEETPLLSAYNPSSVLCTAREIITLWVSRMVMFNRYFRGGAVPFNDVFIHAMIQDGDGRKMSKSLGNGVDPLDIIESHGADAMRFTLCHMTTQTQDVRMPVSKDPATGKNTSPKFDLGRNFANKLWNAARFAMGMLGSGGAAAADHSAGVAPASLSLADRWILSRLATATRDIESALRNYQFSDYAQSVYDLLWRDFCDWYLEAIKPTIAADAGQRAALRATLDSIIRLLHPVMPFITEAIHERLREVPRSPVAGVTLESADLLCSSSWPVVDASLIDDKAVQRFERVRALVEEINKIRAQHKVHEKRKISLHPPQALLAELAADIDLVRTLGKVDLVTAETPAGPAVAFRFEAFEIQASSLAEAVDASAEKERLERIIADSTKKIATFDGRLNNPGYLAKAPPKLVDETKAQRAAAVEELEAARAALGRLG
ncbi:MAG: valine--tRNA ligase [Phycisphaeraceae bacterium]|nr:valine--tRNA ligase [Phycisphaeraceae bacterium]